jgi:hypothetical protein
MLENCTVFKHFLKGKKLFFCHYLIILRLIPIKFKTLKPPNVHFVNFQSQ